MTGARNHNTLIESLKVLSAEDHYKWIRESVAHNCNTPIELLKALSMDAETWVRALVACNPNFCKVL